MSLNFLTKMNKKTKVLNEHWLKNLNIFQIVRSLFPQSRNMILITMFDIVAAFGRKIPSTHWGFNTQTPLGGVAGTSLELHLDMIMQSDH